MNINRITTLKKGEGINLESICKQKSLKKNLLLAEADFNKIITFKKKIE